MSDGDVFQLGHTYRFKAKISLYGDTILAAKEDISVALNGIDTDSYTWTISEYSQIYENMVIYFEFTCEEEAQTGMTVSGTVTSAGSATDSITVRLYAEGSMAANRTVTVKGNTAGYCFTNVPAGTYTLKVTKAGHQTFEGKIVVSDSDVVRNVTLSLVPNGEALIGDVNLDGQVNSIDSNLLKRSVAGEYQIDAASPAALNADINGDGQINSIDSNLLKRMVAGEYKP
jgi:hypothetical protein